MANGDLSTSKLWLSLHLGFVFLLVHHAFQSQTFHNQYNSSICGLRSILSFLNISKDFNQPCSTFLFPHIYDNVLMVERRKSFEAV